MWSDSLLAAERAHLVRLLAWGGTSVVVGVLLLLALHWMRGRGTESATALPASPSPLLLHFAVQTAAWGAIDLAICAWAQRGLAIRDFAGAQRLLGFLWLNTGLDAGYVAVGLTLALTAWRWGARLGGVGAGIGIIVQGLALLLLDLRLLALIGPVQ